MIIIKKIIPFERELLFKTKVSDITSISLEHHIDKIEEDLISGVFKISGDYKMTEASITRESFDFNVGFDIALDNRYDISNIVVDIDDFNYQVINDDVLKVKIDLYIDGDVINDDSLVVSKPEDVKIIHEDREVIDKSVMEKEDDSDAMEDSNVIIENNIFGNISDVETYVTYFVYVIKEGDTIDTIIDKYNVSKEDISMYNNIEDLNPGDKIIVPASNGE